MAASSASWASIMSALTVALFLLGVLALAWFAFKRGPNGFSFPEISIKASEVPKKPKKPATPIIGKCSACGKEVTLPFKCKYCGQLFCDEHRLPENHSCKNI